MTFGGTDTRQVRLEQMLAFGRSDTYITARLGVDKGEIQRVRDHLETVGRQIDDPHGDKCGNGLHVMTAENTYRNSRGAACCRACKRASNNAHSAKRNRGKRAA